MVINTNVSSLGAQEANINTTNNLKGSLEKLSTGLKINKAADDASGLAIADKLRTQATSLNQAIDNGNSAVTLLQIADKSMAEQSNILDTVKAKLIQASTSTTSADGREAIRKDISKLLEQLDNIATQTNYNGTSLLQQDKTAEGATKSGEFSFQMGETSQDVITVSPTTASNTQSLGDKSKGMDLEATDGVAFQTTEGKEAVTGNASSSVATLTATGLTDIAADDKMQMKVSDGTNTYIVESDALADADDDAGKIAAKFTAPKVYAVNEDGSKGDEVTDPKFTITAAADATTATTGNFTVTGKEADGVSYNIQANSFKVVQSDDSDRAVDINTGSSIADTAGVKTEEATTWSTKVDLTLDSTKVQEGDKFSVDYTVSSAGASEPTEKTASVELTADDIKAVNSAIDDKQKEIDAAKAKAVADAIAASKIKPTPDTPAVEEVGFSGEITLDAATKTAAAGKVSMQFQNEDGSKTYTVTADVADATAGDSATKLAALLAGGTVTVAGEGAEAADIKIEADGDKLTFTSNDPSLGKMTLVDAKPSHVAADGTISAVGTADLTVTTKTEAVIDPAKTEAAAETLKTDGKASSMSVDLSKVTYDTAAAAGNDKATLTFDYGDETYTLEGALADGSVGKKTVDLAAALKAGTLKNSDGDTVAADDAPFTIEQSGDSLTLVGKGTDSSFDKSTVKLEHTDPDGGPVTTDLTGAVSNSVAAVAGETPDTPDTPAADEVKTAKEAGDIKLKEIIAEKLSSQMNSDGLMVGFEAAKLEDGSVNPNAGDLTISVAAGVEDTFEVKDATVGDNLDSLKNIEKLDVNDAKKFQAVVDAAITDLNGIRADFGSGQNQVESAVRNLMTQATNVTTAESVIRDVDYAQESANFNKQNIIAQAGSYALSQSNSIQQNVLKLLQ